MRQWMMKGAAAVVALAFPVSAGAEIPEVKIVSHES